MGLDTAISARAMSATGMFTQKIARQVTYAGHPLYRYAGDAIPGAITGQGSDAFGARWDVLTAAGTKVTTAWPLRTAVMP